MILYLDTSALVKLYVREADHALVRRRVRDADHVATSRVAYAEARSALARLGREGIIGQSRLQATVEALKRDLARLVQVELTGSVSMLAGDLAQTHALRGFDAVHLASAVELARMTGGDVSFSTFDARQADAARAEGLVVD